MPLSTVKEEITECDSAIDLILAFKYVWIEECITELSVCDHFKLNIPDLFSKISYWIAQQGCNVFFIVVKAQR